MQQQTLLPGFDPEPVALDELFFALLPDEPLTAELDRYLSEQRARHLLHGKRVKQFHMTLQAIEATAGLRKDYVEKASRAAESIDIAQFGVRLERSLSFPRHVGGSPFVLTATEPSSPLLELQRALTRAMLLHKLPTLMRSFTPHITLLYDTKIIDRLDVEPIVFPVREFVLIHARTNEPYKILNRWALRTP